MYKNIFFLITLTSFILFSCDEEPVNLEDIQEVVVEGYLAAGTSAQIRLTELIVFGNEDSLQTIDDAEVYISSDNETYSLEPIGDGFYKNEDLVFQAEATYNLEFEYFGKTITASTFIPSKTEELSISESLIYRTQINDFTDLQNQDIPEPTEVTWTDPNDSYYFISLKNLEADPELVNNLFADNNIERPEIITPPEVTNTYFINQFRDITHFGNYEVIVFKVNPEYAELYQADDLNTNSFTEAATNIENGFGIFTGVNSDTILFEVKQL